MACEPIAEPAKLLEAWPDLASAGITLEEAEVALEAATMVVEGMLDGRQIRRCTFDLRPYRECFGDFPFAFYGHNTSPWLSPCIVRDGIVLPDGVTSVVQVWGAGLPIAGWTASWDEPGLVLYPANDTSFPRTTPAFTGDDFIVTVTTGTAVSRLARNAVFEVANDIAQRSLPSDCNMDPHVTYLAAQGVFMTFDADKDYDERFTSLVRLVSSVNPNRAPDAAIYTPREWSFHQSGSDITTPWQ